MIGRIVYSEREIAAAITALSHKLDEEYQGKDPLLLVVLKGAFIFAADLVRAMDCKHTVAFVAARSYEGVASTGEVVYGALPELTGRHVVLVEDIVDTGRTVAALSHAVLRDKPASLKVCALLDKPTRREVAAEVDYVGFTVPDLFVIGYGMDLDGHYRNLPFIGAWEPEGDT